MIELLMAVLELLGLIDSQAKEEGPFRWYRRYPRVVRGVVITCWTLVCAVLLLYLVDWLGTLPLWGKSLVIGVIASQLAGFFILLIRRNKAGR